MIVDSHVHVWEIDPPRYPVGPTAPSWNTYPDESGTADELVAEMNRTGVDRAVLVQSSFSTWDNGYIVDSVARFPDRFVGHGLIDPEDAGNADLVSHWMDRGLVGFRFHPGYYEQPVLLSDRNRPFCGSSSSAVELSCSFTDARNTRNQVDALANRYPGLTLILDHLFYPEIHNPAGVAAVAALARHERVVLKLSDVHGRSRESFPYRDTHRAVRTLVGAFGPGKTIWGTGFPGRQRAKYHWPELVDELRLIRGGLPFLEAEAQESILGGTAAAIWGW